MLATITTLIISNIVQWVAYSAVIPPTNLFYCGPVEIESCAAAFLSNQIYQIVAIIVSIVGMYSATIFGILPTLRIAAIANFAGSSIRLLSSFPFINSFIARQVLMLLGTSISAISQMYFVVTSKVSESWFYPKHRASANVACSISLQLGVVIGTFLPSLIIPSNTGENVSSYSFVIMNVIIIVFCTLPLILTFICRKSVPKTPPSPTSQNEMNISVSKGILNCLKDPQFLIQMVIFSINFSIVNGVIYVSNVINYRGYDLKGYPITISTIVCVFVAYFVGKIADQTRKFREITMINSVLIGCTVIALRFYLLKYYSNWYDSATVCILLSIAMSCCAIQLPIGNEMCVETMYPVHESISTGIFNTFGQSWLFCLYFILDVLQRSNIIYGQNEGEVNWKISLDFWAVTLILNAILAFFFLKPRYNRIKLEQSNSDIN